MTRNPEWGPALFARRARRVLARDLVRKGGAKALDPRGDLQGRTDRRPRMGDDQALVEMHHPLLDAQRALAQTPQARRQLVEKLGPAAVVLAEKLDPDALGLGLPRGQFALIDGALEQEPGGDLHEPRGQAHAFGRIGDGGRAGKAAGFLPSRTVEVRRGLLDQRHPFSKEVLEGPGGGKAVNERNRGRGRRGRGENASRSFVLATHTPSLPSIDAKRARALGPRAFHGAARPQ